jgi:hypothetical protein
VTLFARWASLAPICLTLRRGKSEAGEAFAQRRRHLTATPTSGCGTEHALWWGITLPRKLQTAGLFVYTPDPTIGDVMSNENLVHSRSSGDRRDLKPLRSETDRVILSTRFGKRPHLALGSQEKEVRTWKAMASPGARC